MILSIKRLIYELKAKIRHNPLGEELKALWDADNYALHKHWHQAEFIVIDTETTGLDPRHDTLLSIGWVVIKRGHIQLNSAQHIFIKVKEGVGHSATIHQIRDCELRQGMDLHIAMSLLLNALHNRIAVFHHAPMDLHFLNTLSKRLYNAPLLIPCVDTLAVEKQRHRHNEQSQSNGFFKLATCRGRYNLPPHSGHNALTDAIATAELLLAQIAHKNDHVKTKELV